MRTGKEKGGTNEALKPCRSSMNRWTSCRGLLLSLYCVIIVSLCSSHDLVMVRCYGRRLPVAGGKAGAGDGHGG